MLIGMNVGPSVLDRIRQKADAVQIQVAKTLNIGNQFRTLREFKEFSRGNNIRNLVGVSNWNGSETTIGDMIDEYGYSVVTSNGRWTARITKNSNDQLIVQ